MGRSGSCRHKVTMDILEYTESVSKATLEVARKSYDDLHERVYKLATVLAGGGGAVGAYALGKIGSPGTALQTAPLSVLAMYWFGAVFFLLLKGATSNQVSPGNGPDNILGYYGARLAEQSSIEDASALAMRVTRGAELDLMQARMNMYIKGCDKRASALDWTFIAIALSPIPPGVTALLIWKAGLT